jgi:hypothetical protein
MLWPSLFVGVAGLWVVTSIVTEHREEPHTLRARTAAVLRKAGSACGRAVAQGREAWDRRSAARRPAFPAQFSSRDREWDRSRRVERIGWRDRLVAVMELVLFVALLSALFAGAMAVAAMKFGHLHG